MTKEGNIFSKMFTNNKFGVPKDHQSLQIEFKNYLNVMTALQSSVRDDETTVGGDEAAEDERGDG